MNPSRSNRRIALLLACLATFAGGQAQAVTFPEVPLESGVLFPPPNVRFILDDSGSMNLIGMPAEYEDVTDTSGNGATRPFDPTRVTDAAYNINTIHYDPRTTYLPWMTATAGTRLAAANYNAASRDTSTLDSPYDLRTTTQSFFVPKIANPGTNVLNYRRWLITGNDAPLAQRNKVFRTDAAPAPAGYPDNDSDADTGMLALAAFAVPANVVQMTISAQGGTHGDNGSANDGDGNGADLYLRSGNTAPTTTTYHSRSMQEGNDEYLEVMFPAQGTWRIGLNAASRFRNVVVVVTFYTGTEQLPNAARTTVAQEKQNYANWYAYHRSRMKVAKAGASEAFSALDDLNLRIGYDSINRGGVAPLDIPVGTDDGLFRGANKAAWFAALHAEDADGSTYLHRALQRAGEYFSDEDSTTSPYRSSSNDSILACRQNYSILTTDGYWNSTSGYTAVGDADGTDGPDEIAGVKGNTFTYEAERPYIDNLALAANRRTDTLADVAMHYWKTDLAPGLDNNVPASAADDAFWQHMVTFGVSIGLAGTLNPAVDVDLIRVGSKEWPDVRADSPGSVSAARIDDLLHASVNGRGDFVVASNTTEFANALTSAFELLDSRSGSGSNVSTNSTSTQNERFVFQASYDTGRWSGMVRAFAVEASGVADDPTWTSTTPAYGSREIFTWDTAETEGATFPTAAQTTALDRSARSPGPVTGANNVAYLAGNRAGESTGLRKRDSTIGDIANSSPFYEAQTDVLYVGANDGMLHAFDATTGVELMAYVPAHQDFAALADLSSPLYEHRYFVDGPIVVTTREQTPGKNILVGALGRGGKSLYALDVTDVRNFDAGDVLWEITDPDLGNVLGEPLITKAQDGTPIAIVGNGLNSNGDEAVLFVIDLNDGTYEKIGTDAVGNNGMFAPRGWDDDNDKFVDRVFASDYQGNVWKFDFTGADGVLGLEGEPLFSTPDGQPISSGLALARDPGRDKLFVVFGTGSYFTAADAADRTVQSLYAVIDDDATVTRDELQAREIEVVDVVDGFPVRAFEAASTLATNKKGWYIDLDEPTPGERLVTRPFVYGQDVLIFATRIPPFDTRDSCSPGGRGYINALDVFNGTSFNQGSPLTGLANNDRTVPGEVGELPVGSVDLGINMPTQPTVIDGILVVGGSTGVLGWIALPVWEGTPDERRSSWREIEGD